MPPIIKVQRDDIINKAFEVLKTEGIDSINARYLAKKLNCSVQPIFSNFKNMDDLKLCILKKAEEYFYDFIASLFDDSIPKYKQVGINYIKFAKEEPILFKILFLDKNNLDKTLLESETESFKMIKSFISSSTKIEDVNDFHFQMWIFTHGLACLLASNNYNLSDDDISNLLSKQFKALMYLNDGKEEI